MWSKFFEITRKNFSIKQISQGLKVDLELLLIYTLYMRKREDFVPMKTLECRGITLSDKQTKICVPITGTDLEEIKEQAEKIANMNPDVVEWRADFYDVKDNDETEFEQCLKAINDNLKKSQLFIHIEHQMKVEKRVLMLMIIADFASMFQKYLRNTMWQ